jgi:hemerythrin-like metal-binding protein
MANFGWDESCSVGVTQIDNLNRHLLELFSGLHDCFTEGRDICEMRIKFEDLSNYFIFHFACEEIWMSRANYKQANQHHKDHEHLCKRLSNIHQNFQDGELYILSILPSFVASLTIHIKKSDTCFGRFIANNKKSVSLMHKNKQTKVASLACQP